MTAAFNQKVTDAAFRELMWDLDSQCSAVGNYCPKITREIISIAVENWPEVVPLAKPVVATKAHQNAKKVICRRVREEYEKRHSMGIIFSAVIWAITSFVVSKLLERWWDNDDSSRTKFRTRLRLAQHLYFAQS